MSDIVEQAARVLNSVATSWGAPGDWRTWREEAQALADAGLLRGELTDDIWAEAARRYPPNHLVDDPFGATGVAETDPYGYDDTAREAFVQGAVWQRAGAPRPTQEEIAEAVQSMTRQVLLDAPEASADVIASNVTRAVLELLLLTPRAKSGGTVEQAAEIVEEVIEAQYGGYQVPVAVRAAKALASAGLLRDKSAQQVHADLVGPHNDLVDLHKEGWVTETPSTPDELICYLNGGHQWEERGGEVRCRYCRKKREQPDERPRT